MTTNFLDMRNDHRVWVLEQLARLCYINLRENPVDDDASIGIECVHTDWNRKRTVWVSESIYVGVIVVYGVDDIAGILCAAEVETPPVAPEWLSNWATNRHKP